MRTVNATLLAALAAGEGRPIVKATIGKMDGTVIHTQEVVSYKLTARQLEFEMKYVGDMGNVQTAIWLERGVTLNGVDYTITTSKFYLWHQTYLPNGRQKTVGGIFPKQYYAAAGDDTYENVITALCTAFGKTAVFRDTAAAWLDYQFMPAGKVLITNDANNAFNLLRQKYLIFACDNGDEEILFYALDADTFGAEDMTVTVKADFDLQISKLKNRQFLWRDEVETVHTAGSGDDPIHNLGYLESTDDPPARMTPTYIMSAITRPRLDVQDGDTVSLAMPLATAKMYALVTEEYRAGERQANTAHSRSMGSGSPPTWHTLIAANPIFENTEGGALPSTIERVSNYTPLNTSMFDGVLSSADNNLQAAMDTLDGHVHAGGGSGITNLCLMGHLNDNDKSIASNTYVLVPINTAIVDSDSIGDTANNRIVIAEAGLYEVVAFIYYRVTSGRNLSILWLNGAQYASVEAPSDGTFACPVLIGAYTFAVNDELKLYAYSTGSTVKISPNNSAYSYLYIKKVG